MSQNNWRGGRGRGGWRGGRGNWRGRGQYFKNNGNRGSQGNRGSRGGGRMMPDPTSSQPRRTNMVQTKMDVVSPYQGWSLYFPDEVYSDHSPTVQKVHAFEKYFISWIQTYNLEDIEVKGSFCLDFKELTADDTLSRGIPDLHIEMKDMPQKILSCMGLAMHQHISQKRLKEAKEAAEENKTEVSPEDYFVPMIHARVMNFSTCIPLKNLKANSYGKFVSVKGTVVRVSNIKPLCTVLAFECNTCGHVQKINLPDGKYTIPTSCPSADCRAKIFHPQRSSNLTETIDWQTIRIQEIMSDDQKEAGRIPRTIECELTRDLVDSCVPGDIVTVSGIVKVNSIDEGKGKNKDKCMFLLYIYANSVNNSKGKKTSTDGGLAMDFTMKELYGIEMIQGEDQLFRLLVGYLEQQTSSVFHQMTAQNIVGKIATPKGTISGLLKGISDVLSITSESDQEIPKGLQQKRRVDVTPGPSGIKRIRKDIEKTPTIHLVEKTGDDTLKEKTMKYSVDFDLSSTDMEDILDPDFDPDDPTYEPEGWKNISIVQSELDSCEDEQGLEESVFEIGVDTEEEIPDETFPSKGTQQLTDIEEHIITEDKCIVTHQMLKELIAMYPKRRCGICQVDMITEIKKVGCVAECVWRCCNGHVFRWATSSMMPNGVYLTNFQAMSAIILSGNNYFKVALFAKFLSLSFPGPTTFHRIQTKCVVPVVNEYWFTIQQSALEEHRAVEVIVSGDGRMDSPGHTAKYCTYTVMNQEDKRILALEVVDKRETMLKSGLMEARGFQKAMSSITNAGVVLKEVVTDAHPQISKIMKTTYQQVRHSYDMWHGAKNLGKKISKIACTKGNGSLTPWLKDITNHFFHSAEFCNGDVLQMKTKWASILNHVTNRHSLALGECDHGPIDEDREQKPWLKPASNVMKDLHKQILDKRLLRTFPYYTTCQTTSELESFNNHLLMYAPKRNAFRSLCPSIYGHELVKAGLVLGLFGGTQKFSHDKNRIPVRGDPHLLIVGDPGLGKSQMLQATANIAPRSVYVCGNTTTTSGLTVTLSKDGGSGDYALEAGALVLADQGCCCIDEFDKMSSQHQALLEAMEQQSISIAKAGIVCSLPARTSILAAANPVGGHYNKAKTVAENLKMGSALLSRFDLVFILLDKPDEEMDSMLSEHVMALHSKQNRHIMGQQPSTSSNNSMNESVLLAESDKPLSERLKVHRGQPFDPIPPLLLRKYIGYARKYVHPKIGTEAAKTIQKFYLELRRQHQTQDSTPITTRQLESLIRLTEARAKLELREEATKEDAEDVIEIMKYSMVDTYSDQFGGIDFLRSQHGSGMSGRSQPKKFIAALQKLSDQTYNSIFTVSQMQQISRDLGMHIPDFGAFIASLNNQGFLLKKGPKVFQLQTADY